MVSTPARPRLRSSERAYSCFCFFSSLVGGSSCSHFSNNSVTIADKLFLSWRALILALCFTSGGMDKVVLSGRWVIAGPLPLYCLQYILIITPFSGMSTRTVVPIRPCQCFVVVTVYARRLIKDSYPLSIPLRSHWSAQRPLRSRSFGSWSAHSLFLLSVRQGSR